MLYSQEPISNQKPRPTERRSRLNDPFGRASENPAGRQEIRPVFGKKPWLSCHTIEISAIERYAFSTYDTPHLNQPAN